MKPSSTRSSGERLARRLLPLFPLVLAAGASLLAYSGAAASTPNTPKAGFAAATKAGDRVYLPASVHPWIARGTDLGRMDPAQHLTGMSLLFKLSPAQRTALDATLHAQQDPTSPSYHKWLSPEDYAAHFGATAADVARATAFLTSHGLTVDRLARNGSRLHFSGAIGDLEATFAMEMHHYEVDGKRHFAMASAPAIPTDMSGFVLGLHGMHDFRLAPPKSLKMNPQAPAPITLEDGGAGTVPGLAPADFATIYDVGPVYTNGLTGTGQKVAVAEQTDFNDDDVAYFRTTYGLSTNAPVRVLIPNSGDAYFPDPEDLGEAELDVEWAGAVAKDATVEYVFAGNGQLGVDDALLYSIDEAIAPVASMSYGSCESGYAPADAIFVSQEGDSAAAMGITVLVSAGDSAAAGCDESSENPGGNNARRGEYVDFPASVPSIVAVGGTQFNLTQTNLSTYVDSNDNALSYIPESAWNETAIINDAGYLGPLGGGGGVSRIYPKPFWQVPYTPKDNARDVPDMALSAAVYTMPYITAFSWTAADGDGGAPQALGLVPVGGTSCAAPSFASIVALVNQAIAQANPTATVGLGNANPMLYTLANNTETADAFHDVTMGDNIVPCTAGSANCPATPPLQYGYSAGPGYDLATGLGTIDVAKLVTAWSALTPTSTTLKVTASGMTEGSPLQLDATIASTAMANSLSGSAVFYYETFDAMGNLDLTGTLGTVQVTASTSGAEGATASLKTVAPIGAVGSAKIMAFYAGDTHYLASWSAQSSVSATPTLDVCPTTVTLAEGQSGFVFQTTGGVQPVTFDILDDESCGRVDGGRICSSFNDAGVFTAGPKAGSVTIAAIDSAEAYVTATVTVSASADGGALPVVSCASVSDAGVSDAGITDAAPTSDDASISDASPASGDATVGDGGATSTPSSSGCSCTTAGDAHNDTAPIAWSSILVGLAALSSRRRRRA